MSDAAEPIGPFAIVFEEVRRLADLESDLDLAPHGELAEIDELRRLAFELQEPEPIVLTVS